MTFTLRPFQEEDKPQFLELFIGEKGYVHDKWKPSFTKEVLDTLISRFLDPNEPVYSVVAIVEDKIVGFANYVTHRFTWTIEDALYLNDLFIAKDFRSKGLGRSLVEYIYQKADKLNCKKCYWNTEFDNYKARILYSKVGVKTGSLSYRRPFENEKIEPNPFD
ncbi:unnamed protein product [Candida verbasci]|uniref:N-acetyltransferase domain-containing protein n=1 Tax=Candida verbasci TaxID=1227364 RepID=A0A9W4XHJ7_9ASCO|nr:unnamed protein product [Candida verbasci]